VHDKEKYPRIASWANVDHGGRYDAFKLVADIKEAEVWIQMVIVMSIPFGNACLRCYHTVTL